MLQLGTGQPYGRAFPTWHYACYLERSGLVARFAPRAAHFLGGAYSCELVSLIVPLTLGQKTSAQTSSFFFTGGFRPDHPPLVSSLQWESLTSSLENA